MDVVPSYLELCLRLGRHVDGLVDSYYGPPELQQRIEAEELRAPSALATEAVSLAESLDGLDERRRRWLEAQLRGLETVARKLAGEQIDYEDEVERCYGVRPERVPEDAFETAHRDLDEALPGTGSVGERYRAWREEDALRGEQARRVIDDLTSDFRARTEALVGLPDGDSFEVVYVSDEPWAAFNYYLGGLRSRIAINADIAMTPSFVAELVAHEAYPGHHTEHAWKEQLLVRDRGQAEESALMVGTPASLISEGIAGLAPEILLGDEEQGVTAAHVEGTGVAYDPEVSRAVQEARRPLGHVGANIALLLHREGGTVEEAREYHMRWGLLSPERAEHAVRFISDPLWRSYVTTYTDGYDLCREFVGGDVQRFKRLLKQQLTPDDLR
jgi:hypothetical protein